MQGALQKTQLTASFVEYFKENHENTTYVYFAEVSWMVIWMLHGKMNIEIWFPTFMSTVLLKCWQLDPIMALQHKEWFYKITSFPVQKIFWHHKNGEIIKNDYVSRDNVSVTWH